MLDIIKKMRISVVILIAFIFIGCKQDNYKNKAVFYINDTEVLSDDVSFYSYKNGYYIHINKKSSYIYDNIVDSIVFSIDGKRYNAYPLKLYFSRDIPNSNFEYPINNKTKKIETVSLQNKVMFGLGFLQENIIEELEQSGKIKISRID